MCPKYPTVAEITAQVKINQDIHKTSLSVIKMVHLDIRLLAEEHKLHLEAFEKLYQSPN